MRRSFNKNTFLNKFFINIADKAIFILLILIILIFSITIEGFFSINNFNNISRQIAVIGIISVGITLAIISGGIDLSVGSIMALSVSLGGVGITEGLPLYSVYLIILVTGIILGSINGFLITRLNIKEIIVTLGTLNIYRGAAIIITKGIWVTGIPSAYLFIGEGYMPILLFSVVSIILIIITKYTIFGINLYAIGGNEQSSIFSGVPTIKYKMYVYMLCGFFSALAGIVFIGRSGFVQPQVGVGYEFSAITAVVIGGTSIAGGNGSITRTILGSILMGILLVGLTMLGINPIWEDAITGILLLLAIFIDSLRFRLKERGLKNYEIQLYES